MLAKFGRSARLFIVLVLWCFGLSSSAAIAAESAVLLRNGNVLIGQVVEKGHRLTVTLTDGAVIRLDRAQVDLVAPTLDDLYQAQWRRMNPEDVSAHIRLAQWCLRNDLINRAADGLLFLAQRDPHHPAVSVLETQLRLAAETAVRPAMATLPQPMPPAHEQDDYRKMLDQLPPEVMVDFRRSIQPLLVNRCGQATCHGRASDAALQIRSHGSRISRTETLQNLAAIGRFVDRQQPHRSALLAKATSVHGTATEPPLDTRQQEQIRRLVEWVQRLSGQETDDALAEASSAADTALQYSLDLSAAPGAAGLPTVETDATPTGEPVVETIPPYAGVFGQQTPPPPHSDSQPDLAADVSVRDESPPLDMPNPLPDEAATARQIDPFDPAPFNQLRQRSTADL